MRYAHHRSNTFAKKAAHVDFFVVGSLVRDQRHGVCLLNDHLKEIIDTILLNGQIYRRNLNI
jgi:hypothetical protein